MVFNDKAAAAEALALIAATEELADAQVLDEQGTLLARWQRPETGLFSGLEMQVAVLFLDSGRFKEINDNFGHAAGEAVLMAVADRVRAQLREEDLVARLGGDEFANAISITCSGDSSWE